MLMKQGRMKGQAFITFPNEEAAKSARKDTNGFILKDKPMVVVSFYYVTIVTGYMSIHGKFLDMIAVVNTPLMYFNQLNNLFSVFPVVLNIGCNV